MTSILTCTASVLIFTGNIPLSLLVTLTTLLVSLCLSGFVGAILKWEFGAIQAIGLTTFMGMSIDYVLHMAHGYNSAHGTTRKEKVQEALVHMGSALLGGAITTAGATAFLFPTWIYLFHQMGVMLFVNVLIALFYTFFFLAPLLDICGPVGECGDLYALIGKYVLGKKAKDKHVKKDEGNQDASLLDMEDGFKDDVYVTPAVVGSQQGNAPADNAQEENQNFEITKSMDGSEVSSATRVAKPKTKRKPKMKSKPSSTKGLEETGDETASDNPEYPTSSPPVGEEPQSSPLPSVGEEPQTEGTDISNGDAEQRKSHLKKVKKKSVVKKVPAGMAPAPRGPGPLWSGETADVQSQSVAVSDPQTQRFSGHSKSTDQSQPLKSEQIQFWPAKTPKE